MDLFIGLDVGTSAVKGVLLSPDGEKIAIDKRSTRLLHPQADFTEIDPEEHVRSVFSLIRDLSDQAPTGGTIRGISMAFASGNALLLDENDNPLSNIISWLDGRAVNKTSQLLPGLDTGGFHDVVGWPYGEFFPMAQIAWFRKNNPQTWRRVARVCMNNDYLWIPPRHRLSTSTTRSTAAGTNHTLICLASVSRCCQSCWILEPF